ncbi:MAG: DUF2339 domain-containing protein [Syntrophomonas sp.]
MEDEQKLELILKEISELKERLAILENTMAKSIDDSAVQGRAAHPLIQPTLVPQPSAPPVSPPSRSLFKREELENLIGKNLLNRVGIIVLLVAVAYFLKYSFDNNWIGPLGRMVIGYLIGVCFLVAGDILMRRSYHYFAQGISGGGIAIIYLTTFAAVNLYHLIPSAIAFALLVFTALTGGLLAVRQNAVGLAFISTLGGFLTPFLIGSRTGNLPALMSYICILDLSVLFLGYYKNWRFLNALALFSTIVVYIVYHSVSLSPIQDFTVVRQGFLLVFWLIFSSLSFVYNLRQKLPSGAGESLLTLVNAGFFFTASYVNLTQHYHDYLAWLAIALSLSYYLVSQWLIKKNTADRLLYLTFLGIGLAFLTAAIPLRFHQHVIETAWLVEATALIYAGFRTRTRLVQAAGLALLALGSLMTVNSFSWYTTNALPLFNIHSLNAFLSVGGLAMASYYLFTSDYMDSLPVFAGWAGALGSAAMALYYLSWEVRNVLNYFHSNFSYKFSVSLTWVLLAVILILGGLLNHNKVLRFLALGLFIITTLKVLLLDLSYMPIVFRIIILSVVGVILVAVSFAYQRAEGREKEDAA